MSSVFKSARLALAVKVGVLALAVSGVCATAAVAAPQQSVVQSFNIGAGSLTEVLSRFASAAGAAAGAGFSLALACDMVVAARDAVFLMAYSNVALSPDGGASWSLAHALPRALATELLMCGEKIAAERLHALGLVNRLSNPGDALGTALQLAERLNQRAPNVLASIKELVSDAPQQPLSTHLDSERDHFVKNLHHANAGEGIAAFLEKRSPRYE